MSSSKYDQGLTVRRATMGDTFVDKALSNTTDFTRPLQNYVTENCWGEVCQRPGLSKKTRSMITVATLAALKASTELKGHVRGALNNGCTVEEIQEILLHSAVYCGMPSAMESFRAAGEVIEQWQQDQQSQSE